MGPSLSDVFTKKPAVKRRTPSLLPSTQRMVDQATSLGVRDAGGINNSLGGQLGRVGSVQPAADTGPLGRPVGYEYNSPLVSRRYDPSDPLGATRATLPRVGGGNVAAQGEAANQAWQNKWGDAQGAAAKYNASVPYKPWAMPSMLNGRALSDMDKMQIAMTRAKGGMDLGEAGAEWLGKAQAGGLGALAGAAGPQAQLVSNQQGADGGGMLTGRPYLQDRAQRKSEARRLRMSGVAPRTAGLMTSPALGGGIGEALMYGGQNAARLQGERESGQNALNIAKLEQANKPQQMTPQQAAAVQLLSGMAEDPANAGQALGALGGVFGQAGGTPNTGVNFGALADAMKPKVPAEFTPPAGAINKGLTPEDSFSLSGMQGNDEQIRQLASKNQWPKWKLDNAIQQYGKGLFGHMGDVLTNPDLMGRLKSAVQSPPKAFGKAANPFGWAKPKTPVPPLVGRNKVDG